MSEQRDAFLQIGPSYNFNRDKTSIHRCKTIDPQAFQKWTREFMYKSSYAHFHSPESVNPKNTAMPGYAGYIPSVKAENMIGKSYAPIAKESFRQDKLGKNPFGLSTTGANLNRDALIDKNKEAVSSKYGKASIQRPYSGWNDNRWQSTAHEHFKDPRSYLSPTYRLTDKNIQTSKPITKSSGFLRNHDYFDGYGWKPNPILQGNSDHTEYRDRFNVVNPFHRDTRASKPPKLSKKQINYRFN